MKKYNSIILLFLALTGASSSDADNSLAPLSAESGVLQQILSVVSNIQANFPVYLTQMAHLSLSALDPDTSTAMANAQNQFTMLENGNISNAATQLTTTQQLLAGSSTQPGFFRNIQGNAPTTNPTTPASYPYTIVNDLTYPTLLGHLYVSPDPRQLPSGSSSLPAATPNYNYLINASSVNITHRAPQAVWDPLLDARRVSDIHIPYQHMYANFYKTVSSVQTFNAYVLSALYAESQNGYPALTAQNNLIQQATSSSWFTTIASEELGSVMRQILLFTSQTYVLMTKMLSVQQQTLTALVMTNSLLIAVNQSNENMLYKVANGAQPLTGS